MNIYLFRLSQTIQFGWKDAISIAKKHNVSRLRVYCDILKCFQRYRLRSMQYVKDDFWGLSKEEREKKGMVYKENNTRIDEWTKECYENRKFLDKWMNYKWGLSGKRYHKRLMAYTKRYGLGDGCIVHYGVELERNHGLNGSLTIGNYVNLGKHLHIDYSGEVIIEDGVKIANGVIIESHHRDLDANNQGKDINVPTKLRICEKAFIGSRAIILDSCNYIGKNARIGAGAVVTKDIPDNAVAIGVPAKVVKMLNDIQSANPDNLDHS